MIDLTQNPIIYVTRDIERALGLNLNTPGYHIISNSTPFAKSVAEGYDNVLLIESNEQLDTWELLELLVHPEEVRRLTDEGSFEAFYKQITKDNHTTTTNNSERFLSTSSADRNELTVVVFKPTTQIEKICQENNWKLLNPPAELSNKIEEKISGLEWLGELQKYLPKHRVDLCKNIVWPCEPLPAQAGSKPRELCKPFIIQFNRAHTGLGTILIESESQLDEIKEKFPDRPVRITEYISGPMFTSNNVVTKNKILVGNISYQITGLKPFTDNKFTTIGNDWSFANKYLNEDQIKQYNKIVNDIGEKLRSQGWKGLFGVDVVVDDLSAEASAKAGKNGKLYLIEINARQPASTTYESQLQSLVIPSPTQGEVEDPPRRGSLSQTLNNGISNNTMFKSKDKGSLTPFVGGFGMTNQITTFESHLMALLDINLENQTLIKIQDGAQIIQRVTKEIPSLHEPKYNKRPDFNIIKYNNTKPNADLMRTQTLYPIMEAHNKLSLNGLKIIDFITVTQKGVGWDLPRGAILPIKDGKILLIERQKFSQHFFTPPGGTKEDFDENILATAKREGKEETDLDFTIPEQIPLCFNINGRDEYYYFAENISGEPKLGDEERERSTTNNSYKLVWVDLKELPNITLLPKGLTEKILNKTSNK
ncbi:MAG: NUDIX domain-containing protein [Candidatus Magasanikiibacteriota bacterium]